MINFIIVSIVVMLLANIAEARLSGSRGPIKSKVNLFVQFFINLVNAFVNGITHVGVEGWIRSVVLGVLSGVCASWGGINSRVALGLTVIVLGLFVYIICWWAEGGSKFCEAFWVGSTLGAIMLTSIRPITGSALAIVKNDFLASVVEASLIVIGFAILAYIFLSLIWEKNRVWEKVVGGIFGVVFAMLCIYFLFGMVRWNELPNMSQEKAETAETAETGTIQLTPQTSKAVVETEEEPVEEQSLATSGPNWGTTPNGVWHDYTEYADFDNKVKLRAFGYDYSGLWQDEDALKEAFLQIAENEPEALAFYSFDFFNKEEKKALGINGLKVGTDFRTGDYAGIDANFDKEGGGELQEDLYQALSREVLSDNVRFNPIKTTGLQKTSYIYWEDLNKDGYITPEECFCCYDNVSRKDALQVEVQRKVQKMGKDGGYTWETKFILNLDCGFQICWKDKVPKGVPQISEVPTASGNNPPPTPDPGPGPGPGGNPKKDPTKEVKTTVNQPNTDKNSVGKDTNNGVGAKESTAEPDTSKGDAPSSTDMTPEQFEKKTKETAKEVKEQEKRNDATPTVKPKEGTNVDQTGEKKSAQPTTEKVPTATVNGETVAKQGEHVTGEIEIPK